MPAVQAWRSTLLFGGALLAFLLVQPRQVPPARAVALATPDQVHLSIVGDPSSSMAITWRSASDAEPHWVEWWPAGEAPTGDQATAESESAPGERGYLHKAELTGLRPNTEYHYRVSGDGDTWSDIYTFRTAPTELPSEGVVFTVNADVGTSRAYPDVGRVMAQLATEKASLHLIAGDITYANLEEGGTEAEEYWFSTDLPPVATLRPVMVSWGNHEYIHRLDVGIFTITRYFQLPRNGVASCNNPFATYSFFYAGVHFVALDDPASGCFDYAAQQNWLQADLARAAANPKVKWKVVVVHQPPMSSGANRNQLLNRYAEFDRFGVDLVIAGHNHEYERTWPMDWRGGQIVFTYEAPEFPTYLIAGVGGVPTSTRRSPPQAWSAYRDEGRHVGYVRLTATEKTLLGEYVGKAAGRQSEFQVKDEFTITR